MRMCLMPGRDGADEPADHGEQRGGDEELLRRKWRLAAKHQEHREEESGAGSGADFHSTLPSGDATRVLHESSALLRRRRWQWAQPDMHTLGAERERDEDKKQNYRRGFHACDWWQGANQSPKRSDESRKGALSNDLTPTVSAPATYR
jgi:hypothetical protein